MSISQRSKPGLAWMATYRISNLWSSFQCAADRRLSSQCASLVLTAFLNPPVKGLITPSHVEPVRDVLYGLRCSAQLFNGCFGRRKCRRALPYGGMQALKVSHIIVHHFVLVESCALLLQDTYKALDSWSMYCESMKICKGSPLLTHFA